MSVQDLNASGDNMQMPVQLSSTGENALAPVEPFPPRQVQFGENPISTVAVFIKQTDHRRLHRFSDKEGCYYFYDFKDPNSDGSSSESSESYLNTDDNSDTVSESDSDNDDNNGIAVDIVDSAESGDHTEVEKRDVHELEEDKFEDIQQLAKVDNTYASKSDRFDDDIGNTELTACHDDEGTDVDEVYRKACSVQEAGGNGIEGGERAVRRQHATVSASRGYKSWGYVVGGGVAAVAMAASAYTIYKWFK